MWTYIIAAALIIVVVLIARSIYRSKKTGKGSCCGGCSGCATASACKGEKKP